ncbi:MAG: recombinase RecT, partial [Polaromonas sp.]
TGTDVAPVCRVGAVIAGQQSITWGEWLSAATVTTKNSPLWKTNPKQQLGYLQVKNWARSFCPGAILGVYTSDELETPVNTHMGAVEIVPPTADALPTWPEDKFAERLPIWKESIIKGKTVDGVITFALTKGVLTDDQLAQIKALPAQIVKEAGARKPDERSGPIVVTYAQVADALNKAQDMDKLNDAATLINAIEDAAQQGELNALYDQRATALN